MEANKYLLTLVGAIAALSVNVAGLEIVKYDGDKAYLLLSEHSVNRLIFPTNVTSKVYSKEKGVSIEARGRDVFVKWVPLTVQKNEVDENGKTLSSSDPIIDYTKGKVSELFIVTEDSTYSLVLKPVDMPAETVMITNPKGEKRDVVELETKDIYTETMKMLTKIGFDRLNEIPNSELTKFEFQPSEKVISDLTRLPATVVHKGDLVGSIFRISLFEIKNTTDKTLYIAQSDFARIPLKNKVAISLFSTELFPYQRTSMVIVSKNVDKKTTEEIR